MRPIVKMVLRAERRRARRHRDWKTVEVCDDVLASQDAMELVCEAVRSEYEYSCGLDGRGPHRKSASAITGTEEGIRDWLQAMVKWAWENRQVILTIAQLVLTLLLSLQPPYEEEDE